MKRAQVEFHNFASLGEPERAFRVYAEENVRRGAIIAQNLDFIEPMTPFLEIGANAGHTSYLLCNQFQAQGFASDISADSLRHGITLMDQWKMPVAPVRMAADALHLPFRDGSLRFVMACQMLSQFQDIEAIFLEVKRVLAPGGVFFFCEEPLRRLLTLKLYRAPYWESMKWWERKLFSWGLLGYFASDVIGAAQEENFGIRQNHRMELRDWDQLIRKHFFEHRYGIFVRQQGWGERMMAKVGRKIDKYGSDWVPARLLGGTLAAFCMKEGAAEIDPSLPFESRLQCPDCQGAMRLDSEQTVCCTQCEYRAPNEGGVYNLIRSSEKRELYPGDSEDLIDFTLPGHERKLREGWYDLEGVYGNKYRWIGGRATARLRNVRGGRQRLRVRGHANEQLLAKGNPKIKVTVNGQVAGDWNVDRVGLFILEADLPAEKEYEVVIEAGPLWQAPPDERSFTVNLSMLRLIPVE